MKLWNKKDKELYRVYFKKNGCSMLMFEKLSYYAAMRRKRGAPEGLYRLEGALCSNKIINILCAH